MAKLDHSDESEGRGMGGVSEQLPSGALQRVVFDRLVKGEARETLLAELRRRLDEDQAAAIVGAAVAEIDALKASGDYESAEYKVYSKKRRSKSLLWDILGVILLVLGGFGLLAGLNQGQFIVPIMQLMFATLIFTINRRA